MLHIHIKGKSDLLKCPSNQLELEFWANEKDEATDRIKNKEHSTSSAMEQTAAQSCFIRQKTIKAEIMWENKRLTIHTRLELIAAGSFLLPRVGEKSIPINISIEVCVFDKWDG